MLWPVHFDGQTLNSLGEHKVRMMLQASAFLLTPEIFVTSGQPDHVNAVRTFLDASGFQPGDVYVRTGTNPSTGSPAAVRLAQQGAMQDQGKDATASDSAR